GTLDVRLDPWQVEYGSEAPAGSPEPEMAESVDASVELPPSCWRGLTPPADAVLPRRLLFVDGVRRVEARVIARRGGRIVHGAFGSYGVGCVAIEGGAARCVEARIDRVLALDSGESIPDVVSLGPALDYRPLSTSTCDVGAPLAV